MKEEKPQEMRLTGRNRHFNHRYNSAEQWWVIHVIQASPWIVLCTSTLIFWGYYAMLRTIDFIRQQEDSFLMPVSKETIPSNTTETTLTGIANHRQHLSSSISRKERVKDKDDSIFFCFVTSEFSKTLDDVDMLPSLSDPSLILPPSTEPYLSRHFFFTNQPQLSIPTGWTRIVLLDLPYQRCITQSRWPKFMGWTHDQLRHCRVIFYGDAYLMNPINKTAWTIMASTIVQSSSSGIMQPLQMGSNHKPIPGPVVELKKNARMGKVSWEAANITIAWLRNQSDYPRRTSRDRHGRHRHRGHHPEQEHHVIPVYKNALFGYDTQHDQVTTMMNDFWKVYSMEQGSWRDQPYWAYFLYKHHITPIPFPIIPLPLGPPGRIGHNGHIYINVTHDATGNSIDTQQN